MWRIFARRKFLHATTSDFVKDGKKRTGTKTLIIRKNGNHVLSEYPHNLWEGSWRVYGKIYMPYRIFYKPSKKIWMAYRNFYKPSGKFRMPSRKSHPPHHSQKFCSFPSPARHSSIPISPPRLAGRTKIRQKFHAIGNTRKAGKQFIGKRCRAVLPYSAIKRLFRSRATRPALRKNFGR